MEKAFLDGLREKPDDAVTRLVYADWLDEQPGDEARRKAEYLRLEARLLDAAKRRRDGKPDKQELPLSVEKTRLALTLPSDWLALVARVPIENCQKVGYRCPQRWESLQLIDDEPRERFCGECGERVHWCESIAVARQHAALGECVAFDERLLRTGRELDNLSEVMGGDWTGMLDAEWAGDDVALEDDDTDLGLDDMDADLE
ncbi:MAG: TIGR02996 domain-containing protein [Gemmataceae bacterium]|nr:TIGR02996 domain-containing protein [Gemmataceae bacterium]